MRGATRRLYSGWIVVALTALSACSSGTSGTGHSYASGGSGDSSVSGDGGGLDGAPGACGQADVRSPDGRVWHCTFDDEFSGSSLDTSRWRVEPTTLDGFTIGDECLVNDGQHVYITGGNLVLAMTRADEPHQCGRQTSQYLSGMVTTLGRFAQTYGRFEVRALLPQSVGLVPALWLYPEATRYGPWPRSGEIDIAESFGMSGGIVWPHIHYFGADDSAVASGTSCFVPNPGAGFHTYTVDWTPDEIAFSYDGRPCWRAARWTPAPPLLAPAPFDEPFSIVLSLGAGALTGAPTSETALPADMMIDFVRVWGP